MAIVLITGGSRGIGAACVRKFAARGDTVAFFYRVNTDAAEKLAAGTGATAMRVDITDPAAVEKAVSEWENRTGGIEILVNNAGISQTGLFTDLTEDDWKKMIDTNLSGTFRVTRAVAREMVRNHKGSIVNIGSMWGKTGASCEAAYSAAKAGLRGLTMALAKELGPSGIRVNCVEPGVIDTDMNQNLDRESRERLCDATPLCRIGLPGEVADAVCFLASDAASFITGQCLGVDGGFAI